MSHYLRLLALAAITAIAAGTVITHPDTASAAITPAPTRIVWGVNSADWYPFKAAVPAARARRIYYGSDPAKWPKTWPVDAGEGVWELMSLQPLPGPLLSGQLDHQLRALIASAPAHSLLTIWHENCGANPLHYPPSVHNPATFVRMQKHMERLVQGSNVRFGTVIIAPVHQVENWLAPHLDWYGYDFYSFPRYLNKDGTLNVRAIWTRMTNNLAAIRQLSGVKFPLITIPETNAARDSQRKRWFTILADWFATHNGHRAAWIMTRWEKDGKLTGPWPPSAPVVADLRYLAELYSR